MVELDKKNPLFGAAILAVSLQLKEVISDNPEHQGYNEILDGVIEDLKLDPAELDEYIQKNRGALEQLCKEKGIGKNG